ncbi:hypothetical protein VFPPC_00340 [Pochonia chlamydosporia 170]|uniref:Uncharacterized protein n=1 Tax=Pochonia chlamydosporia 170 TaxID=1380566 RepID=A0A179G377_METCM|nr:hypothetical protein VFPPC_00340 [Pochonia chlamydosporia 170]OAQ72332.1 hypothetical protein VFPPC_00340 [Pochonia chlamydosporia 170]
MDVLPNSGRLPEEEDSGNEIRGDSSQNPGIGRETITTQSTKSAPAPAATPPAQTNTDPVVSFKGPFWDNSNPTDRVLPESHEKQEWQWTVDNTNPAEVNWIAWLSSPALNTPSSTTIEKINVEGPVGRRLSMPPSKDQTVIVHYGDFLDTLKSSGDGSGSTGATDFMRLQVGWKRRNGEEGVSNSGVFFLKYSGPDTPLPKDNTTGYEGSGTVNAIVASTSTTAIDSGATEQPSPASPAGSSESHGSGLAAGAIAGIAVGGAVAVILIAGLVWFLLRRRRSQREQPYDDQYKTAPFMEDKNLATAQVVDSRRSGHSEESGRPDYLAHGATSNPAAGPYGGQNEQYHSAHSHTGSFANLHDTAPATRGIQNDNQNTDAEYPPHPNITLPIPSRIRHLVEPQHTDADLRRLLAEEDLLDEEIARGT